MAYLSASSYNKRGPQLIRGTNADGRNVTVDRTDGWAVQFTAHNIKGPYTIFQQVLATTKWAPAEPRYPSPYTVEFTEAWHSRGKSKVSDKFLVPRYYRVGATGSVNVLAKAWVVPGREDLALLQFKQGRDGQVGFPWGEAWGKTGVTTPPPGTKVLVRQFEATWDNKGIEDAAADPDPEVRKTKSHYHQGADMEYKSSSAIEEAAPETFCDYTQAIVNAPPFAAGGRT